MHADKVPTTFSCRLQWKARRAEIEVLAKQAADFSHDATRIPVLADTTLVRGFQSGNAAQLAHSPPTWRFLVCFIQVWLQKSGEAFPLFARTVLDYMGNRIHHPHQMSLSQLSAYHLREIIYNLDMLAIARTTKLTATSKEKLEDETVELVNTPRPQVETEFYGGEQAEEPENEDFAAETWRPMFSLSHDRLTAILSRTSEVAPSVASRWKLVQACSALYESSRRSSSFASRLRPFCLF